MKRHPCTLVFLPLLACHSDLTCSPTVDQRLVQRHIRRIRQLDDILRGGSADGNLKTYGAEVYADYGSREREDGLLMLIDLEAETTMHLKSIDDGLDKIHREVGSLDPLWKEGAVIRARYARALEYQEDMRQWAEKKKLKACYKARRLLFQTNTD